MISRNVIFAVFLELSQFAFAQPPSLSRHYPQVKGTVYSILQDKKGFLWFGTSIGLLRYDALSFQTYAHDEKDSTSLSDSFIREVIEDKQGYLWVSTLNGGLNRFDPASGKSIRLKDLIKDENFTNEKSFSALAIDPEGYIWAGATKLYRIHPEQFTVQTFSSIESNTLAIYFSRDGAMWLGTSGDGFGKFNPETGTAELVQVTHTDALISERANVIRSITEDAQGNLWLGAYAGLIHYDLKNKSIQHWIHDPKNPFSLPHNSIWNVIADEEGKIWISTWGGGLTLFNSHTRRFENSLFQPGDLLGIPATEIPGLFRMKNGTIWAGTNGKGVYRVYLPDSIQLLNSPIKLPEKIKKIIKLTTWLCIMSEDEGVFLIKPDSRDYWHLTYAATPSQLTLGGNRINDVCERADGTVFFGTENGLTAFYPEARKITTHRRNPGDPSSLNHNDVMSLATDSQNQLWLGTPFGLCRLNDDEKTFTRYSPKPVPHVSITALMDNGNQLLIGTGNEGLFIFDKKDGSIRNIKQEQKESPALSNNYVHCINTDNLGNIWAGTSYGLNCINRAGEVVYQPEVIKKASISSIEKINEGLVVKCALGSFLIPSSRDTVIKIQPYDLNNVPYSFIENTSLLLLHLASNLYTLPIPVNEKQKNKPPVTLTRFELSANSPNPLSEEEARIHPAYCKTIELDFDQNFFSFQFSLLDYNLPGSHRYAYRLNGFDADWNYSDDRNFASYTNIPPGTYQLQLKVQAADGNWYENTDACAIVIHPPWWKTYWAYAGYVLLTIGVLWMARRQVVNRERLKAQILIAQREREALREVDHLKTQFFSNITHEFRTPLTLIQGPAEELMHRTSNNADKQLLAIIKNNANRLLQLINQLLDLAKLDSQQLSLEEKPVELGPWLRFLISQFTSLAQSRNISFRWQITEPVPVVMADEKKLETILTNLLSNALKFTPENGVVNVSAQWKENMFTFRVADTGCGIPAEDLPHIFNRFYQVEHAKRPHSGGTGIGLTLVKEYTELMKGKIEVESTVDKGSTFTVYLPLKMAITDVHAEIIQPDFTEKYDLPGEPETMAETNAPLMLIVEDSEDIRLLIRTNLGKAYRYEEAGNGKEGWEKATHIIPDLIISDLMMPEMDGLELCKKIKADVRTQHIPFIMLTAKAGEENKITGLQTGADDYLVKPFNRDELIAKVHNLMQLRENIRKQIRNNLLTRATPVEAVSAEEKFVVTARQRVEENLNNPKLSVEWLADQLNLGREQCYRKMMAITGLSPSAFIRKIRLQRAAQLLQAKWGPVSQVAYEVGYENLSHFSKAFKEEFGKLPSEYAS
ncbi:MAG: ATP-binding protein [Cyclobacteriaceae bacterium]|nr:ATP-binding protein [Cyclobacteriaceae bacterium]